MKKVLIILIPAAILSLAVYYSGSAYQYAKRWVSFSFCDRPITYTVNNIDPQFNVSKEQVIKDAFEAAAIWNSLVNKNLFVYDPASTLDINLVYDERQSNVEQIVEKKDQIDQQKDDLTSEVQEFEAQRQKIKNELDVLNNEIIYWNNKGGATKEKYNELIRKQKELQKEVDTINATAAKLNMTTDQINQQIDLVNTNVKEFNNLLSVKPEEGIYLGGPNRIDIYIYENETSFRHTIAHELGHALGLDHVDEVDSIMYPISSINSHAAESDKRAIENFCLEQNRLDLIQNDIKNILHILYSEINNVVT